MGKEPEEESEHGAEYETGDDWEIEGGVVTTVDDVARKVAKAEGQFATKVEKSADEDEEAAEEKESASEFAKGVHGGILP